MVRHTSQKLETCFITCQRKGAQSNWDGFYCQTARQWAYVCWKCWKIYVWSIKRIKRISFIYDMFVFFSQVNIILTLCYISLTDKYFSKKKYEYFGWIISAWTLMHISIYQVEEVRHGPLNVRENYVKDHTSRYQEKKYRRKTRWSIIS